MVSHFIFKVVCVGVSKTRRANPVDFYQGSQSRKLFNRLNLSNEGTLKKHIGIKVGGKEDVAFKYIKVVNA